ncbi:MAG: hypothetical protein EA356_00925 [Geminicoccaceae bacterium]|nr:MAG: hypothetical protein EA356_00925 [Geminicoccaceae bacterium]
MARKNWLGLIGVALLTACAGGVAERPQPWVHSAPAADPLRSATLEEAVATAPEPVRPALLALYAERGFAPLWFDGGPFEPERARVVAELRRLGTAEVDAAWAMPGDDPAMRLEAEWGLTALMLDAADRVGRTRLGAQIAEAPSTQQVLLAMAESTDVAAFMAETPFGGQRNAHDRYRQLAAAGGWPTFPDGANLEPGAADGRLEQLRARLLVTGDLEPGTSVGPFYDAALVLAVKRFQARHGLAVDGVVGPATRRALNVPVEVRLAQLDAAGTQRDALHHRLGERYVMVNVPAYELVYVRGGTVHHRANVVVGAVQFQTPIFSHAIDHLVFNPSWSVPRSIANRSLLPQFQADAAKMEREGYRLVNADGQALRPTEVDWAAKSSVPFRVQQRPGPANALGDVKFMFPNEHAVYLHDTPSKSLFGRPMRAASNGCVRVQDPMTLAELLLDPDGWTRGRIDEVVAQGRLRTVRLSQSVPVHLTYVTAWQEADGTVHFRDDVYGLQEPALQLAAR